MNRKKLKIKKRINSLSENITNPTVQADSKTEMGVPIPSDINVESSKEYGEEHEV